MLHKEMMLGTGTSASEGFPDLDGYTYSGGFSDSITLYPSILYREEEVLDYESPIGNEYVIEGRSRYAVSDEGGGTSPLSLIYRHVYTDWTNPNRYPRDDRFIGINLSYTTNWFGHNFNPSVSFIESHKWKVFYKFTNLRGEALYQGVSYINLNKKYKQMLFGTEDPSAALCQILEREKYHQEDVLFFQPMMYYR